MLSPALVAVVAGGRSVDVSAYAAMVRVCLCLAMERIGMAIDARESGIVRWDQVAIGTYGTMVRDSESRMVEGGAQPRGGVVASGARRRVTGRDVIRDISAERSRALPGCDVASVTIGVRGGEIVIAIDVALRACRACEVEARQRPAGGAVIEFPVGPFCNGVTSRAGRGGRRKARFDVIRNVAAKRRRAVPSRQVTTRAVA